MPIKNISKRSDPNIQNLRQIRDGKKKSFIFAEGEKLASEMCDGGVKVTDLYFTKESYQKYRRNFNSLETQSRFWMLSDNVMSFVSDLKTPPGLIGVGQRPTGVKNLDHLNGKVLILVLHELQSPQNMGALIRTAEGAGVDEVWCTTGSADPFSPKALRGASGSTFRVPVRWDLSFGWVADKLKSLKVKTYGAVMNGTESYSDIDWSQAAALVLGSEGKGLGLEQIEKLNSTLRIPMSGKVESLNVGVAGAVCLFEARRQRLAASPK